MIDNPKILVIDDDPGIRESYQLILAPVKDHEILAAARSIFEEGAARPNEIQEKTYALHVVDRGERGIQFVKDACAQEKPYSVAFVDMQMPGLDGSETAKKILEIDPDIKIVIVTAYSEKRPADIIQIIGRDDIFYLRKPFNPEEIRQFARALTMQWNTEHARKLLAQQLSRVNAELEDVNKNLKQKVQEKMLLRLQSEKNLSLRILTAGIAHEINKPIALVYNNLIAREKFDQVINSLLKLYDDLLQVFEQNQVDERNWRIDAIRLLKKKHQFELILNEMTAATAQSLDGLQRVQEIIRNYYKDADQKAYADINQLIESTLNLIWNAVKSRTEIIKNFGRLPPVFCCPMKLSQAFFNLLTNAVEAIQTRGVITISTRAIEDSESDRKKIEINIADTGVGIPDAHLARLFDPFFSTKPPGQCTGLGLAIVDDIIKLHQGEVKVTSEVGAGTTFTILLPVEME